MYLQGVLAENCARNPRYSMRAFARRLGINHSTLSQLLRGKRQFSARTIKTLGGRLALPDEAIARFVAHEQQFPSNHSGREIEVQHQILELITLESFKPDVAWISRVLSITADAVHVALAQLLAMGLVRMESANRWVIIKEAYGKSGGSVANPREGGRKG
jgi:transcriptional regulator with XRE-family HTH domain